jgi:DNA-binding Xre family transcriptional regulator
MQSKLIDNLVAGLKKAQKHRCQLTEIAEETGVSRSVLIKVMAEEKYNITSRRLERIYCALIRRGHLEPTFEFDTAA